MNAYTHPSQTKIWRIKPLIPSNISENLKDFPPLLRQLLYNRGNTDAKTAAAYLGAESPTSTDPLLMLGMPEALRTIEHALQADENITIYGDYDTDGVTAAALLFEFFSQIGRPPRIYIPNRFEEGYGLKTEAIEQLAAEGTQLLITVDCGIRSLSEVRRAKELNMRVIITDHHQPDSSIPPADAVVNPHQHGDPYPYKELAGVGLAYKLAEAWLQTHPSPTVDLTQWLDLVAIGTVVDMAPLTGENRALVKRGLEKIRQTQRQGLFSLAQVAGINPAQIRSWHLSFSIGPRLNASGRLESAMDSFKLLVSKEVIEAGWLAQQLDMVNINRKEITNQIIDSILFSLTAQELEAPVLLLTSPDYNAGVIGLAAGRLAEMYYKPTIIGTVEGANIKASCRSIPGYDINEALNQCDDLLVRHGGHPMAAGLTVSAENIAPLHARLNQIAYSSFDGLTPVRTIEIDYQINLEKLRPDHISDILDAVEQLEPTGVANPAALFCSRDCDVVSARTVGKGEHLKLQIGAGSNRWDAIAFRKGAMLESLPAKVDIAYLVELNEFNGRITPQLNIQDIQPAAC